MKKKGAKEENELSNTQEKHDEGESSQRVLWYNLADGMKRYKVLVRGNRLKNGEIINQTIAIYATTLRNSTLTSVNYQLSAHIKDPFG